MIACVSVCGNSVIRESLVCVWCEIVCTVRGLGLLD